MDSSSVARLEWVPGSGAGRDGGLRSHMRPPTNETTSRSAKSEDSPESVMVVGR